MKFEGWKGYVGCWLVVVLLILLHNGFVDRIMSFEEMTAAFYFSALALALHGGLKWAWEKWL